MIRVCFAVTSFHAADSAAELLAPTLRKLIAGDAYGVQDTLCRAESDIKVYMVESHGALHHRGACKG